MQISERTINTALNQLADTYEHGPPTYCFETTNRGDPNAGAKCCVLGHMTSLLGKVEFWDVATILGHANSGKFYDAITLIAGESLCAMSQAEVAVALRKYAQAYHPVPDKVALVIVKPQALAA